MGFDWTARLPDGIEVSRRLDLDELSALRLASQNDSSAERAFKFLFGTDLDDIPLRTTCGELVEAATSLATPARGLSATVYKFECSPMPGMKRCTARGVNVMH